MIGYILGTYLIRVDEFDGVVPSVDLLYGFRV